MFTHCHLLCCGFGSALKVKPKDHSSLPSCPSQESQAFPESVLDYLCHALFKSICVPFHPVLRCVRACAEGTERSVSPTTIRGGLSLQPQTGAGKQGAVPVLVYRGPCLTCYHSNLRGCIRMHFSQAWVFCSTSQEYEAAMLQGISDIGVMSLKAKMDSSSVCE